MPGLFYIQAFGRAAYTLGKIISLKAIAPLTELLSDKKKKVRKQAIRSLGEIRSTFKEIVADAEFPARSTAAAVRVLPPSLSKRTRASGTLKKAVFVA
jgi:HEAT repeat protein